MWDPRWEKHQIGGVGVRTKSKGHSRGNTPKHGLKEATVPHCISLVNTKNELWSDEIKRTDSPLPFLVQLACRVTLLFLSALFNPAVASC